MRITHDPQARLDYSTDWTAWLADSETITAQTVAASSTDLTVETVTQAAGVVTAWVSGGQDRTDYVLTFHVETSQGRRDDRMLRLACRQR